MRFLEIIFFALAGILLAFPYVGDWDKDGDKIPDAFVNFFGALPPAASPLHRGEENWTSFQTGRGYSPIIDVGTDIVIIANNSLKRISSWKELGYKTYVMVGFRAWKDYLDGKVDGKTHYDEVQTRADGSLHMCVNTYYMVPTENRIRIFQDYFLKAVENGAEAICPEEPEFFTVTGYSEAFKREWEKFYGRPWAPPTDIQTAFDADYLKGYLQYRLVTSIYKVIKEKYPNIPRFLLAHSPVNYAMWGIIFPHNRTLKSGLVDAFLGQVWTGTSRSPVPYGGNWAERTFENAYLEYSSCYHLARDIVKEIWFLMDPVEDNPNRTMQDYKENYEKTLIASLFTPEVAKYEVMPWPERIYGRVPKEFETEIGAIVEALQDMHNQEKVENEGLLKDVATFTSDSMMYERGGPAGHSMGGFYGLTLPLVMKGMLPQVLSLDRVDEAGYLRGFKVLLLSYDEMKPLEKVYNERLAEWVRKGGVLIFFGGLDAQNALDLWWWKEGFTSPLEHLFKVCGLQAKCEGQEVIGFPYKTVLREERVITNGTNEGLYEVDLTPFLKEGKTIYLKFADAHTGDGWGALLYDISLIGKEEGEHVSIYFRPDSEKEKDFLYVNRDSRISMGRRFADRSAFWVYKLDLEGWEEAVARLHLANQFLVQVAAGEKDMPTIEFDNRQWSIPHGNKVAIMRIDGAQVIGQVRVGEDVKPAISVVKVGKGHFVYCGLQPSVFSESAEMAELMRHLAKFAMELAGVGDEYKERGYVWIKQGKYLAVRCLEKALERDGMYVNLLDPYLSVQEGVKLKPWEWGFYKDVGDVFGKESIPRILAVAGREVGRREGGSKTEAIVKGPEGARVCMRIYKPEGYKVGDVKLINGLGEEVQFQLKEDENSVALIFPNHPLGVGVRVEWEKAKNKK